MLVRLISGSFVLLFSGKQFNVIHVEEVADDCGDSAGAETEVDFSLEHWG